MQVNERDTGRCTQCGGAVILARTTRKSKGEPVDIVLEVDEIDADLLSLNVKHQWMVSRTGERFHAGQPTSKAQRAALIAGGVGFHAEHGPTCKQRRAAGHR